MPDPTAAEIAALRTMHSEWLGLLRAKEDAIVRADFFAATSLRKQGEAVKHRLVAAALHLAIPLADLCDRLTAENAALRTLLDKCCDAPLKLEICKQSLEAAKAALQRMVDQCRQRSTHCGPARRLLEGNTP